MKNQVVEIRRQNGRFVKMIGPVSSYAAKQVVKKYETLGMQATVTAYLNTPETRSQLFQGYRSESWRTQEQLHALEDWIHTSEISPVMAQRDRNKIRSMK